MYLKSASVVPDSQGETSDDENIFLHHRAQQHSTAQRYIYYFDTPKYSPGPSSYLTEVSAGIVLVQIVKLKGNVRCDSDLV